jgi:GT2 family glycosyltransferase
MSLSRLRALTVRCREQSERLMVPEYSTLLSFAPGSASDGAGRSRGDLRRLYGVRRKMIADTGPLDEGYFLHCEDLAYARSPGRA